MQTDVPLKRLTRLCPADLLPLLGVTDATVVGVETLELPASTSSLDTVLRLRNPDGAEYLHLVEWQGYHDPRFLWRTMGYLAWLGQNRLERPILATVVYLKPGADTGATLTQEQAGSAGWALTLPCVRLWEQDAAAAVASGTPGLLALAPLLGGATTALVEQAAQALIRTTAPPIQSELLAALGIFAEPLLATERFVRLVTKERLMASDLISYLFEEKAVEFAQEKALLEERLAAQELRMQLLLQQAVEDVIIARFPSAPAALTRRLRTMTNPEHLQTLLRAVLAASDLDEVERLVAAQAG